MSKSATQKERKGGCGSSYSSRASPRYGGDIVIPTPGTFIGRGGAWARGNYVGAPLAYAGPGGVYIGANGGGHHDRWGGLGVGYGRMGVGVTNIGRPGRRILGGGHVAYGGQGYAYQRMPAPYTPIVFDPCARPNYFAQQFQEKIVNGGAGLTRYLPDDVIATLDLPRIERYAQIRCGRQRNPSMCAGADMMVSMIDSMHDSHKEGKLYVGWPGGKINALAAIAILGLCIEKVYRGMRGEWPDYDAGDLCIPLPAEGPENDPLYQQALAMSPVRCGWNGMRPRLSYQIAKMLAIAKGRGREMTADEVAALKAPPPMMMALEDTDMMDMGLPDAMTGGYRLPARLGGAGRRIGGRARNGGSTPKARKGGSRKTRTVAKPPRSAGKARKTKY